jgi:hypothetical protein
LGDFKIHLILDIPDKGVHWHVWIGW